MHIFGAALAFAIILLANQASADESCVSLAPTNTDKISESFKGKIEGNLSGILARIASAGADIQGEYQNLKEDELYKYDDHHRLYVWQRILYLACIKPGLNIDINKLFEMYLSGPPVETPMLQPLKDIPFAVKLAEDAGGRVRGQDRTQFILTNPHSVELTDVTVDALLNIYISDEDASRLAFRDERTQDICINIYAHSDKTCDDPVIKILAKFRDLKKLGPVSSAESLNSEIVRVKFHCPFINPKKEVVFTVRADVIVKRYGQDDDCPMWPRAFVNFHPDITFTKITATAYGRGFEKSLKYRDKFSFNEKGILFSRGWPLHRPSIR